jgi:hypothetical protein
MPTAEVHCNWYQSEVKFHFQNRKPSPGIIEAYYQLPAHFLYLPSSGGHKHISGSRENRKSPAAHVRLPSETTIVAVCPFLEARIFWKEKMAFQAISISILGTALQPFA